MKEQINYSTVNVSTEEFLGAFFAPKEQICIRAFDDSKQTNNAKKYNLLLSDFPTIKAELKNLNEQDRHGIFFVANGGGQTDAEVMEAGVARVQFTDDDKGTLEEQLEKLTKFSLPSSIIVQTQRGIHPYWLLVNGDIHNFRDLQERLRNYFGTDNVKNESRVMRLPGFYHQKGEPFMVKVIHFEPSWRYTQEQLSEALPELPQKKKLIQA